MSHDTDTRIQNLEAMVRELLTIVKAHQYTPNYPLLNTLPKTKLKTVKNDTDTPKKKRPPTGYLVFSNANRDMVKQHLSDIDESVNPKDVTRELARRWKLLSDEERGHWNSKAKSSLDADSTD